MQARIITLANNFYQDEELKGNENKRTAVDSQRELEEYCCLGYYDALGVKKIRGSSQQIRDYVNMISMEGLKGDCSRRNIVCIPDNEEKDDAFWKNADKHPCLFVSLIRIKWNEGQRQDLKEIIGKINEKQDMMAYYTYDHSEAVVVKYDSGYLDGMKSVLSLYESIEIFKMYSIFAVKEKELIECGTIKDEEVDCILNATVKDRNEAEKHIRNLEEFLRKAPDLSPEFSVTPIDTLGKSDLLVEICHVPIRQLLRAYKMGGLLTHTNREYNRNFFNIESQLFACAGRRSDGTVGDQRS